MLGRLRVLNNHSWRIVAIEFFQTRTEVRLALDLECSWVTEESWNESAMPQMLHASNNRRPRRKTWLKPSARAEMEPCVWPVLIRGAVCVARSKRSRVARLSSPQATSTGWKSPGLRGWFISTSWNWILRHAYFIYLFFLVEIAGPIALVMTRRLADREMMDTGVCTLWLRWPCRSKGFLSWFSSKGRAYQSVSLLNSLTRTC